MKKALLEAADFEVIDSAEKVFWLIFCIKLLFLNAVNLQSISEAKYNQVNFINLIQHYKNIIKKYALHTFFNFLIPLSILIIISSQWAKRNSQSCIKSTGKNPSSTKKRWRTSWNSSLKAKIQTKQQTKSWPQSRKSIRKTKKSKNSTNNKSLSSTKNSKKSSNLITSIPLTKKNQHLNWLSFKKQNPKLTFLQQRHTILESRLSSITKLLKSKLTKR
jgi:hypothetical protein